MRYAMRQLRLPAEVPLRCDGRPTYSQQGFMTGPVLLYRHDCAEEQIQAPGWPSPAAEDHKRQVRWHTLVHLSFKVSLPEGRHCC